MHTNPISHNVLLGLIIICLFAFVATPLQSWDTSFYINLNTAQLTFWGASVVLAITLLLQKNHTDVPTPIAWGVLGVIISIVLLPFINYPLSSVIASPVGNTGIAQNLSGMMIAYGVYCLCRDNPKNQGYLVILTLLALITFTTIGIFYGKIGMPFEQAIRSNVFARWGDVYALIAMPSLVVMAVGLYNPNQHIKYISIAGLAVVTFNVYISNSNSAQMLLLSTPVIYGVLWLMDKYTPKLAVLKPYFVPLTLVALTVIIAISILWISNFADANGKLGGMQTVLERSLMMQTYFAAVSAEPVTLLTGWGWGQNHYIQQLYNILASSSFETDVRVYDPSDARAIAGGGLGGTSLHNMLADIMAATGIFGLIAFLGMLYALGKMVQNHNLMVVAWVVLVALYSVWFPTAVTVVPLFVAIGITCALIPTDEHEKCDLVTKINTPMVQKGACGLGAVILIFGTFYYAKQVTILSKSYQTRAITPELYYDNIYNQDAVNYTQGRKLIRDLASVGLNKLIKSKEITENQLLSFIDSMDLFVHKSEQGHKTMTMEFLTVTNIVMVQGDEKIMIRAREKYFPLWVPTLKEVVAIAPYRFDLWQPYFQFLEKYGQHQEMGNMAQYILENGNPNDPMALLYRGIAFRYLGDEQSAQKDIQQAIDNGISAIVFNARDLLNP